MHKILLQDAIGTFSYLHKVDMVENIPLLCVEFYGCVKNSKTTWVEHKCDKNKEEDGKTGKLTIKILVKMIFPMTVPSFEDQMVWR